MAQPEFGTMIVGGKEVALSPIPLPVVYFDNAPGLSHLNGIIGITLTVSGNAPVADGSVVSVASVVAHLKCNIQAALLLKAAIEQALLLATPVENPDGPKN